MTPLEKAQVLHPFICQQFGYEVVGYSDEMSGMRAMLNTLKDQRAEAWEITPSGLSTYADSLHRRVLDAGISDDTLACYDLNIVELTQSIGLDTPERSWKPFQYLALLFTEYYLDRYFTDPDALLTDLNRFCIDQGKNLSSYKARDLRMLAVQSATGSGKTLLLHANIKQYMHYLHRAGQQHSFNKIILVTPDERMSEQHLRELKESGFETRLFSADRQDLFGHSGTSVEIIDLHKLDDKAGVKRVAVESFEENNLVLVDEGHLGTTGKKWRDMRAKLARNGFTFEYSATFNQAVSGQQDMCASYGKSLIYDYSYGRFYADGYGKDYNIRNLPEIDGLVSQSYLLACLLQFYQQRLLYDEKRLEWRDYNLAAPLLVFLGNTVTADNKRLAGESESDVTHIVRFLAWVMTGAPEVKKKIGAIIREDKNDGLVDSNGNSIFANAFPKLKGQDHDQIFQGLQTHLFNGSGSLKIVHSTLADEIQLRAGDAEPFGVINVGDTSGLFKKLSDAGDSNVRAEKSAFHEALFNNVDTQSSRVTTVIGAQKFAAGWNSWRVSTMGLLNVGQGQGPQIIQMFGRGVRLKGKDMTLKRHTALGGEISDLRILETLNIFGVRANYMAQFRDYLAKNDIAADRETVTLCVTSNFGKVKEKGLKVLRLQEGKDFNKSEVRVKRGENSGDNETVKMSLFRPVETIISRESGNINVDNGTPSCLKIADFVPDLLNKRRIYEVALERKRINKWDNLEISHTDIDYFLSHNDWFDLEAPVNTFDQGDICRRIQRAHELIIDLIDKYFAKLHRRQKSAWEAQHMELVELAEEDDNFIYNYEISVDKKKEAFIKDLDVLISKLRAEETYSSIFDIGSLNKAFHGYQPLLYNKHDSKPEISVRPVRLNKGEFEFVQLIQELVEGGDKPFEELFVLRNLSRGRGVGFFDDYGGYFPDFIIWLLKGDSQHILFVDPKGLTHLGNNERQKFDLHQKIKELEVNNFSNVNLHSYIWSVTPIEKIPNLSGTPTKEDLTDRGIYLKDEGINGLREMFGDAINIDMNNP